ncbi:MAG: hypothetical protein FD549_000403 [Pelagibacterales bacterium]|nr:hypothetical protein [Pelagibacterales bacterium]|tara:strand:- start:121 stop:612 length:492 start_codon:yes stop_codon:yes gene_type:complete
MFAKYNPHNNKLYNNLVKLSRNIYFYRELKLKDNFESRIILIFLHYSIIMTSLTTNKKIKFPQHIFDNIFQNIEYHLRELGYGDVAVNKKMKILNKIFYNILLKINLNPKSDFKINKDLLLDHFSDSPIDTGNMSKLCTYFVDFHNYCFELDLNTVIEGKINY